MFRAIFSDMMATSKYTGLEVRTAVIEERLLGRGGVANNIIVSRTPANYGQGATPSVILPETSIATGAR